MRRILTAIAGIAAAMAAAIAPHAQTKPAVTPADYGQFESLAARSNRGGLSPDGRWLAYGINRVDGKNELRIARVGTAEAGKSIKIVPFGSDPTFSSPSGTSGWIAYSIGVSEDEQDRMRTARVPIRRKLGLLDLASDKETIVDGIESFAFDRTGRAIAMKRYAPAPPAGAGGPGGPGAPPATGRGGRGGASAPGSGDQPAIGTTLIVRDLASGTDTTFGNVTEYSWQPLDSGTLLAMTIGADGRVGNGLQLYDAASSTLRILDSSNADYVSLTWRDRSSDLVVLRSRTDDKHDGPTHVAMAWTDLGRSGEHEFTLDPATTGVLDGDRRIVSFRRPSWLEAPGDRGAMILLGVGEWPASNDKPVRAATQPNREGAPAQTAQAAPSAASAANDKPDVDVWHWNDASVMPRQKLRLTADRRRSLPAVWHLASSRLATLGKSFDEEVAPIRGTAKALVSDFTPYLMDRSIGRPALDLAVADLETGVRTPLRAHVTGSVSVSPAGKYILFTEGDHYWTIDLATGAAVNITRSIKTSFADLESDSTAPERPLFGVAGWTKDDAAVVLNDKLDLWRVSPDGRSAVRLTNGAAEQVRHRYVPLDAAAAGPFGGPRFGAAPEPVDLDHGYVSLFGLRSKKSGYGRFASSSATPATNGNPTFERLVWTDRMVSDLDKAEHADVFVYSVQGEEDSPDLLVGGPGLTHAAPATATNPFLSKYAWTHAELVDYTVKPKGKAAIPLQGILHYPVNYDPSRRYPMVVYLYEKLSDNLHRFLAPSERDYYNLAAFTEDGYFVLQPDIVFQPRDPGVSMAECVRIAIEKASAVGAIDPARVGVVGHSWGGYDSMFLATHTKLFAAAVAGAGISDLISNYGNHHWSSGIAETDHIETGQQRMVVPLYDDLQAYIRNSAIFSVSTMTTPLLLMTGDADGTVQWHQSVELYNIARRAKKNVVMLVYNGEDHRLDAVKNRVDYHRRIHAWFDHYLKNEPAEPWITRGVTALERERTPGTPRTSGTP